MRPVPSGFPPSPSSPPSPPLANWLLVAAYMGGLFALSSISNPPTLPGEPSDKLIHAILYAGLGGVTLRALVDRRWRQITAGRAIMAVVIAVGYGAFDEFHQSFVAGRQSEFSDLIADATGAAGGAIALWGWAIVLKRPDGKS